MDKKNSLKEKKRKLHKTHSMQFRILATVIFAMLVITVFIGGISIYEVDQYIQDESKNFVVVTCENEGSQINDLFDDMEKSVKVMESYVISDVFKRSPVFRIGGDEFLAVLRHGDLEDCEKLFIQLDLECANTFVEKKSKIPISIARGFARFDSDKDMHFNDVFKRADYAMYENKRKSKEVDSIS